MKLKDVEKAAHLAKELADIDKELERAKVAECFKLEIRERVSHGNFEYVGHCSGVSLNGTGSFGDLAHDLQLAAVSYYQRHRMRIVSELNDIGVNT